MTAPLAAGETVVHDDRPDLGTVTESAAPAWTPNDLVINPPATGMVKVRWSDSVNPDALFWEHSAELNVVR
ncbi:hypothetical protein [Mycobacterium intracellulare]|uniref:hypothetical protein n=1 Tax=Mycobacterium intracellulare TaxID=1767 RepID=UPI001EED469B|nr:hypothetical protein [Mycobacterium intracellulare]MEE3755358.1 hypothetical protein [Mycobacterium intracellulare]